MLNEKERHYAIELAKKSLRHYLENETHLEFDKTELNQFSPDTDFLKEQGCFVTLKKEGHLRGCIGTIISDDPLYENILNNAISAGTKDPRFPQVDIIEWDLLEWEISVMGPLIKVNNLDEIEVGKHGLIMKNGYRQGLLLPQVPLEWNWDKKTFLEQTCYKAGLPKDAYLDVQTEIYSFTAQVFDESN
jgi:AmmeMemoRadiSam system protein A